MSGTHTPGPWGVWRDFNVTNAKGRLVASSGGVTDSRNPEQTHNENVANARLIAAAPDLLEACASVWAALAGHDDPALNELAEECRAAIAKATGETP